MQQGRGQRGVIDRADGCLGVLGGCVNALVVLGIGLVIGGGLTVWGWSILQNARASMGWPTAEGLVTVSEVTESTDAEGGDSYQPRVTYEYLADNQYRQSYTIKFGENSYDSRRKAEEIAATYAVGTKVVVYYDPENPEKSVLEPGVSGGSYIVLGVGLLFLVIGLIVAPVTFFSRDH